MMRSLFISAFFIQILIPNLNEAQDNSPQKRFEASRKLMGVRFGFVVYAENLEQATSGIKAAIHRIEKLENIMSDYDSESELMRLGNSAEPNKPTRISAELFDILQISQRVSKLTNGAFDPTVGRLSRIWRIARKTKSIPQKEEIEEALAKTGWKKISLNPKDSTVSFCQVGMGLDLGGIAKGYAADQAIKVLSDKGLNRCLIDASGDVTVGDAPPGKAGWKIAISSNNGQRVSVSNASVATSGDRFQFLQQNGKRYSHIVDPKTGWGVTDRRLVTVVCCAKKNPGTLADSLASALSVMKMSDAKRLMNKLQPEYSFKIQQVSDKKTSTIFVSGCLKN